MRLSQIILVETTQQEIEQQLTNYTPEQQAEIITYKPHIQQWILTQLTDNNYQSVIDAAKYYNSKIRDNRYQEILRKHTPTPKNILTLTLDNIKTTQTEYDEKHQSISKREQNKLSKQRHAIKLVDNPNLTIIKIEKTDNTDAAKTLTTYAKNTKWCISDIDTAEEYLSEGDFYFIKLNGERYLCHPESEQFMDVLDEPYKLSVGEYELLSPYIDDVWFFLKDKKTDFYKQKVIEKFLDTDNPEYACYYAKHIMKSRWLEIEPLLMKDPHWAYVYTRNVIKPLDDIENHAIKSLNDIKNHVIKPKNHTNGRWPEAESIIMKSPGPAFNYAKEVLEGRWPAAEPYIMKDPQWAYLYQQTFIKPLGGSGRWYEAEPFIMKDPESAYGYAMNTIEGPWPEAEPYIMKDPELAFRYAYYVLKHKWPEAEPYIMRDPHWAKLYAQIPDLNQSNQQSS